MRVNRFQRVSGFALVIVKVIFMVVLGLLCALGQFVLISVRLVNIKPFAVRIPSPHRPRCALAVGDYESQRVKGKAFGLAFP